MKNNREGGGTGPEEWGSDSGGGGGPLPEVTPVVTEQPGTVPDRLNELRERLTRLGDLARGELNSTPLREQPLSPPHSRRGFRA